MDDEVKSRSVKLNVSIDHLKDCTAQILAQVAALAKVKWNESRSPGVVLYTAIVRAVLNSSSSSSNRAEKER